MVLSHCNLLTLLSTLALLTASPSAQEVSFPAPGADPTGKVVDEQGKPIAGARVSFVHDAEASSPWRWAVAQVLASAPLPAAVSDRDGEFVLPLTREQRRLGSEAAFTLHIERDGYVEWREPLRSGLWGYLGTRATLRRLAPWERVRLKVEAPHPGMLVVVRIGRPGRQGSPESGVVRTAAVPPDGTVEVAIPWLPSPIIAPADSGPAGIGLGCEVRAVWPGRTTALLTVDPGCETVIPRAQSPHRHPRAASRSDGAPLVNLQARYRCEDGLELWLECEGSSVLLDERLRLVRVRAQGCDEFTPDDNAVPIVLQPLAVHAPRRGAERAETPPDHPPDQLASGDLAPLRIRVVDDSERPLPGVTIRISDAARLASCWNGPPLLTNAHGIVELAAAPCSQFEVLAIDDTHLPCLVAVTPTKATTMEQTLVLGPQTVYRVVSITPTGKPAAFLHLRDASEPPNAGLARRRPPELLTDSLGRAWLRRRPEAEVRLQVGWRGGSRFAIPEDGTIMVEGPAFPALLLRLPFPAVIDQYESQLRGGGSAGGMSETTPRFAMLLEPPGADQAGNAQELLIYTVRNRPPVFVESADATAATTHLGDVPIVDRRGIARHLPLQLEGIAADAYSELVVAPTTVHHGGAMIGMRHGNLFALGTGNAPELQMTFSGSLRVNVMHPDYLRQEAKIEEPIDKALAEPPLALRLERGARVEVLLPLPGNGAHRSPMTQVTRKGDRKVLWLAMDALPLPKTGETWIRLTVPFALPPGDYEFTMAGGNRQVEEFAVTGTNPVVLDLRQSKAK